MLFGKLGGVAPAGLGDFDMAALHTVLDEQRLVRGLTWAGVTREINRPDARPVLHPISVSSVTGTRHGRGGEGNIVLQMLLWLDRTPESFVPNHPAPTTPDKLLAPASSRPTPPLGRPSATRRGQRCAARTRDDLEPGRRRDRWVQLRDAHRAGKGTPYRLSAGDEDRRMARPASGELYRVRVLRSP